MNLSYAFASLETIAIWSLIATAALTAILAGSQGYGLSRLSLPFLVGTLVSGNRNRANLWGFVIYMVAGQLFGFLYFLILAELGIASWWSGALVGVLHALFFLTTVFPMLPYVHPRMASEYDGPRGARRLEPPGFLGLNYGYRTPLITIIGHAAWGAILGIGFAQPLESLWRNLSSS